MQKFQNMEHSNSRTFQRLQRTFKDLLCFQGLSRAWNFFQNSRTFKDFSRTLWTLVLVTTGSICLYVVMSTATHDNNQLQVPACTKTQQTAWLHLLLLTLLRLNFSLYIISNIYNSSINTTHSAYNLGFIFDNNLAFSNYISSKFCYSHNCGLRCIRPYVWF